MVADERWYFMKEKLQRFMWGRYGNDRFNQFLMIVALVCLALSFFGLRIFYVLALALLVYAYYRLFCPLYTFPSPRDGLLYRMPSSA